MMNVVSRRVPKSVTSKNLLIWNVSRRIASETETLATQRGRNVANLAKTPLIINFAVDGSDIGNTTIEVSTPEYVPEVLQRIGYDADFVSTRVIRVSM